MSVSLFNAVPAGAIEVLLDEENQPWFKRAHVGKFLELYDIESSLRHLDECEERARSTFNPLPCSARCWTGPKNQQNRTDKFLSAYGVMYVIVNKRKSKGKELKDWILRDVIPRGVNKLMEEEHQKAIKEKQKSIDEKDMQIALLDDDLTESQDLVKQLDQRVTQLQCNNTGLQGEIRAKDQEIDVLRQRHVPLLKNEEKNYGITIIAKNDESAEYPFISICGQYGYRKQKKRVVLLKNIGSTEFADRDTPNAIVTYNVWREHGLIETDPRKPRDFRLVNIAEEQLLQLQE